MKRMLASIMALGLFSTLAIAQYRNPNPNERREENRQERASGIRDEVDITGGPNIERVSRNSAWLTWRTNREAATRVRYGRDRRNPGQHAYAPGGSREHRVELRNLRPRSTYYYEIENRSGRDRFKGSFQTP